MLKAAQRVMNKVMGLQFSRNRKGGRSRGVTWKPFSPQYLRSTDGVEVPAWGGVKKVSGVGTVLGRKRPSGRRVDQSSNLMQDTGKLRASRAQLNFLSDKFIRFGPTVLYARMQNSLRPFLFFDLPRDGLAIRDEAFSSFSRLMRREPGGGRGKPILIPK